VSAVIVGVGGFLGVGEKDVAVPFNALKVAEKDGDRYLAMNATKEALERNTTGRRAYGFRPLRPGDEAALFLYAERADASDTALNVVPPVRTMAFQADGRLTLLSTLNRSERNKPL
jgi:hypothetical protein